MTLKGKKVFLNKREDLVKLPRTSGLYFCYDQNDNLLYIGKAKHLKSRIWEHKQCNDFAREGKFYSNMRNLVSEVGSKEKLDKAIRDFEFRTMATTYPVVFDFVFHRTNRIEIEELSHELTEEKEEELIFKLKPMFNYETACDEYFEIRDGELLNDSKR